MDRTSDISEIDKAKKLICEYFTLHGEEELYLDAIADELGLDFKVTIRAIRELVAEKKLEEVE